MSREKSHIKSRLVLSEARRKGVIFTTVNKPYRRKRTGVIGIIPGEVTLALGLNDRVEATR